jgi:hypothetical protein
LIPVCSLLTLILILISSSIIGLLYFFIRHFKDLSIQVKIPYISALSLCVIPLVFYPDLLQIDSNIFVYDSF